MNRFDSSENLSNIWTSFSRWIPLIIGIVVLGIFLFGVNLVSNNTIDSQQESLENALARDVSQCYAVEGVYPSDLAYLTEHYGLTYNEDLFFVDYQSIGGNIYPDITVIRIKENKKGH